MTGGDAEQNDTGREASTRWQGRTIQQFGYALNLILGLSVAALGFEISLVLSSGPDATGSQSCLFAVSLLALILSVGIGLFGVVNRLRDFRATTKTARKRENGADDLDLQALRTFTDTLGERTWLLFWWQIATFGVGVLLLVFAVGGAVSKALSA